LLARKLDEGCSSAGRWYPTGYVIPPASHLTEVNIRSDRYVMVSLEEIYRIFFSFNFLHSFADATKYKHANPTHVQWRTDPARILSVPGNRTRSATCIGSVNRTGFGVDPCAALYIMSKCRQ
jgi:hypothetical protein